MEASAQVPELLEKVLEGMRLVPYRDQGGRMTNGAGHLLRPGEAVVPWTLEYARAVLRADVEDASAQANDALGKDVDRLNQNQFDAVVLFTFNVGGHELALSTLAKRIKEGDMADAANEFLRWDHVRRDGVLFESAGLKKRCEIERDLFLRV